MKALNKAGNNMTQCSTQLTRCQLCSIWPEALLWIHLVAEVAVLLVQEERFPGHGGLRGGGGLLRRRAVAALDGLGRHLPIVKVIQRGFKPLHVKGFLPRPIITGQALGSPSLRLWILSMNCYSWLLTKLKSQCCPTSKCHARVTHQCLKRSSN